MENKIANPAPLGLLGFSMTTILLNIHNAGFFPLSSVIISMGIFYGGIAQIIAGIMDYKRGNIFGATAFTSYGFFWISLVAIWLLPSFGVGASEPAFVAWYLFIWGMFSLFMFIGTLGKSKVMQFVFFTLVILFMLLAIHYWAHSEAIGIAAGWVGIVCGASAFYLAMAELLDEVKGRKILPY